MVRYQPADAFRTIQILNPNIVHSFPGAAPAGYFRRMPIHKEKSGLFVFDYPPHPETFVIELIDDGRTVHARRILSGVEKNQCMYPAYPA